MVASAFNPDAIPLLCAHGAQPDDASGQYLMRAIETGTTAAIQLLVDGGANVSRDSGALLHRATQTGHADCLVALLRNGARPNAAEKACDTLRFCPIFELQSLFRWM